MQKLAVLADAAKYDASCASSGGPKRDSLESGGIGSTEGMGICHADAPDGRCISLLKILLTNFCTYDCAYCINRRSSTVPPEDVSWTTGPQDGLLAQAEATTRAGDAPPSARAA